MFERATRECLMSPTITIRLPSRLPSFLRNVYASSSAWVGWACQPSPALMMWALVWRAAKYGAPEEPCLRTKTLAPTASSVRTVSTSDSPLSALEPLPARLITSALSTLPANSKDARVRVLGS